jgi:malonyl CoA-acyl carrier protein transacylase
MTTPQLVAIVGLGAILPDAKDVPTFWNNIKSGRYSITEVPPERWNPALYYAADPSIPDKTYSKIGGWVREFDFEPLKWGIPIPPRVAEALDDAQKWAIAATRQALIDYGFPQKALDPERVAVILGNSMGGEGTYNSTVRIRSAELLDDLQAIAAFQGLPVEVQKALLQGLQTRINQRYLNITEDTMPGELANIIAGRVANVFNFYGPNFTSDAACASSFAALQAAINGLASGQFDAVLTGGVDHNMGPETFVKFSKIGALSPDGSRPYADGANGFVMGEGGAVFLLKRLEDAEKAGDHIYAVIRSVGASSDGRGKGITAPNPMGQQRAVERAWKAAGVSPASAGLIEGHGTSTKVGDVVEVNSLNEIFGKLDLRAGSIALGSVKSNFGHLKSAAGAAGLLKAVLALHERVLPPSANFERPNPQLDFAHMPFAVTNELRPWEQADGQPRRAGVSAFGFGGTNFHVVLEEYLPGLATEASKAFPGVEILREPQKEAATLPLYSNLLFLGAESRLKLQEQLTKTLARAQQGAPPSSQLPGAELIRQPERLAIAYSSPEELIKLAEKAQKTLENESAMAWQALAAQGVFRGSGKPGKLAFLFPGQGSQYVNMLRDLRDSEPVVAETFREADEIMTPIFGKPLTSYIYVEGDEASLKQAEENLRDTTITQPAVLMANVALLRVLEKFGFKPDMVIGHSLGEYAALVAAGVMSFPEALEVVSARGREMARVSLADNGCMAAVSAPLQEVERIIQSVDGYVVIANVNSPVQSVIGGATKAVEAAIAACQAEGYQAVKIQVSHAFHTRIVAPASEPLLKVIERMHLHTPQIPIAANVTGEVYPTTREEILDMLARQVASPVQFIKGIKTLYGIGARTFVEVGPKRVLNGLTADILKGYEDITVLATNHPRKGGAASLHDALCALLAAGYVPAGAQESHASAPEVKIDAKPSKSADQKALDTAEIQAFVLGLVSEKTGYPPEMLDLELDLEADLGIDTVKQAELFAAVREHYGIPRREDLRLAEYNTLSKVIGFVVEALQEQPEAPNALTQAKPPAAKLESVSTVAPAYAMAAHVAQPAEVTTLTLPQSLAPTSSYAGLTGSVVISGTGLGLPGRNRHVFQEDNVETILKGTVLIDPLPEELRQKILERRIVRVMKSESGAQMVPIEDLEQTIKLAGQRGQFDPAAEFGIPQNLVESTDISTQLAMAAGIEALRDAGIPLMMTYKTTSTGSKLPNRWMLPPALADETGVIFSSAFPGYAQLSDEADRFYTHQRLAAQLDELCSLQALTVGDTALGKALAERMAALEAELEALDYHFDRRFLFRILSMGHSQFAEYIGARGPNTQINAACASMTQAISLAEDWIRSGRCRRVVIISGDDVADGNLGAWIESGFLATGAATAEGDLRKAVLPFDRRRNGMIVGMGAAALVVESEDAVRERGMHGLAEVLSTEVANSAFHGTRLDVNHISDVMERLLAKAEERFSLKRKDLTGEMMFMSHETYTPARGGSAAAEIHALRQTFGDKANQIVIANTKGYTGHAMGVGIEDVVAIQALVHGSVPPIANLDEQFEPDPELGDLNLSHGGSYPLNYALRLGAGFGSQVAMALFRRIPNDEGRKQPELYQRWLDEISGHPGAALEVQQHTLRIRQNGLPERQPAPSRWKMGEGPTLWAEEPAPFVAWPVSSQMANESQPTATTTAQARAEAPQVNAPIAAAELDEIKTFILSLVSEKTGYPVEMLDLDLDLEADLGIDTVKQAELFAAVREHYDILRREDLRLSDYNTLQKVIDFAAGAGKPELSAAGATQVASVAGTAPVTSELAASAPSGQAEKSTATQELDEEAVKAFVLALVSEKTGYSPEMLDLDLDLEADLGIDTVKQAELFAAVRENYGIPRREDLRLAEYNTLRKVIGFVREAKPSEQAAETEKLIQAEVREVEEPSNVPSRRVPMPVLWPAPELCQPTGVELHAGMRIIIISDQAGVGSALAKKLRAKKLEVSLQKAGSTLNADPFAGQPVDGVYFLSALDSEPALQDLTLEVWQALLDERLFVLTRLLQALPNQPFLVTATRCGGLMGYEPNGAQNPTGGLVSGFTKALARERTDVLIKTVDFAASASTADIANHLINETLWDPTVNEVGWRGDQRFSLTLVDEPLNEADRSDLPEQPVYLVSGGTAGIIAPILLDLAEHTQGAFFLLGRHPLPAPDDADLIRLQTDPIGLKKDLMARLAERGEKATPARVEEMLAALQRTAATLGTIEELRKCGAQVRYLVCDVTSPAATEAAVRQALDSAGRVDVLLHAAGVEYSRRFERKTQQEIEQTVAVKDTGFFNLYRALLAHNALPQHILAFSSVAARFGNAGQTDYSAANDLLCRMMSALRCQHPEVKAQVIDWGAWAEVGMASRGHMPELMKRAGIEQLKPAAAAPCVYRELAFAPAGEAVIAGSLGQMEAELSQENSLNGEKANEIIRRKQPKLAMVQRVIQFNPKDGFVFETELDPQQEPFLREHARDGIPLLPGVMGVEAFVEAAQVLSEVLAGKANGLALDYLDDIHFLAPLKFYRDKPRRFTLKARAMPEGEGLSVSLRLESHLERVGRPVEPVLHFSGRVHLQPEVKGTLPKLSSPQWREGGMVTAEEIYRLYFHGPAFQVLEGMQRAEVGVLGKMNVQLPSLVSADKILLTNPRVLELALQTAGICEAATTATLALPSKISLLKLYPEAKLSELLFAEVQPDKDGDGALNFSAKVMDANGNLALELRDYRTAALPFQAEPESLAPFRRLMA